MRDRRDHVVVRRRVCFEIGVRMIIEVLAKARRDDERGDDHLAHVADLYMCDRQTWYRRSGFDKIPFDDAKRRKFDIGHAVEARIILQLRSFGLEVLNDELVGMWIDNSGAVVGGRLVNANEVGAPVVIGHPDAYIPYEDVLLEIKTTDVRKLNETVSMHYALQAAAYAVARGASRAIVHVTHVVPFEKPEAEYEINVAGLRPRVEQRVREVLTRTDPEATIPAAVPEVESAAWACKYCAYREQCDFDGGPE